MLGLNGRAAPNPDYAATINASAGFIGLTIYEVRQGKAKGHCTC